VRNEEEIAVDLSEPAAPSVPSDFDEFFIEEHERLYRALYFVTGHREDAEELMQDAFLKVWERWDRIGEIDDAVGYLFRTALNGFRMRARRAKVAAKHVSGVSTTSDPFEDVDLKEDLRRMLLHLSPRQRAALVLTRVYGYSSEQAGQMMGIRPTTVRALASQGRAALKAT
jgi:RNA polymerase sigma factor (sigma-70 family)